MAAKHRILIVDDEKNAREGLKWGLGLESVDAELAESAEAALEMMAENVPDLVITDLKMPGASGMELLEKIKAEDPTIEVIVITAHSTVESAVEAMRKGAYDYQTKPVRLDELKIQVVNALHKQNLARENKRLLEAVEEKFGFDNIIGRSAGMEAIFDKVRQVAPTTAAVLIEGESGTGKELIAQAIHFNSPRARQPFIAVNCGALAQGLLESELFGHVRGAFTGAVRAKAGRFEMADGGTLFLDEISETSAEFQVKLLRVLEELRFERVGGSDTIGVDVRVIAATNRDLQSRVADGSFREDLYYRLNVINLKLPPLRERESDVPLLAMSFLREFGDRYGKPDLRFSAKAMTQLQSHDWPGNVRELRNAIEAMVVLANTKELSPRNLPEHIRSGAPSKSVIALESGGTLADAEREVIRATLAQLGGNRAATARQLGIGRKTLYRKLAEYGLE